MNLIKETTNTHCLPVDHGYDFYSNEIVYSIEYPEFELEHSYSGDSLTGNIITSSSSDSLREFPALAIIKLRYTKNLQYYNHYTNNESLYSCEMAVEGERFAGNFGYYNEYENERFINQTKELVVGFNRILERFPPGSSYKDVVYNYHTYKWLVTTSDGVHPKL